MSVIVTKEVSRSKQLLDKVYEHLESIDVTKLSMNELKDFLEVVQKGQFLESYGNMYATPNPYIGWNSPINSCATCDAGDTEGRNQE